MNALNNENMAEDEVKIYIPGSSSVSADRFSDISETDDVKIYIGSDKRAY